MEVQLLWDQAEGLPSPSLAALIKHAAVVYTSEGATLLCFSVPLDQSQEAGGAGLQAVSGQGRRLRQVKSTSKWLVSNPNQGEVGASKSEGPKLGACHVACHGLSLKRHGPVRRMREW